MVVGIRQAEAAPAPTPSASDPSIVRIQATRGWSALSLGDLWTYRELMYFLVWRDVKVRYKQTVAGAAWAVLQPLVMMLLFVAIFGRISALKPSHTPYAVFIYSGLLPWQLFAFSLTSSSSSLVANQALVTKVYVPRLVIPVAATLVSTLDFTIGFGVLVGLMFAYGVIPSATLVLAPLLMVFAVLTALSVGIWLSALNVRFRDIQYVLPFLVQLWFFITPVLYDPGKVLPTHLRLLYAVNPMFTVVQGFRYAVLGHAADLGWTSMLSVCVVLVLLVTGLLSFRRTERAFADVV